MEQRKIRNVNFKFIRRGSLAFSTQRRVSSRHCFVETAKKCTKNYLHSKCIAHENFCLALLVERTAFKKGFAIMPYIQQIARLL